MRNFLFLLMAITAVFFVSCGSDSPAAKTCDPACEAYETCDNGTCKTSADKCLADTDCTADATKPICDTTTHECVADVSPECTTDADCTADATKPVCDTTTNKCVAESTGECIGMSFDEIDFDSQYGYIEVNGDYALMLGFYENPSPVGTYDLGSSLNNNYSTCEQCVVVYSGMLTQDDDTDDKTYFQESGSLTITKGDAQAGESAGEVTDIKLIEVTIADKDAAVPFLSTPVANGGCIEIETGKTWAWDNMPTCEENSTRCNGDVIETCDANNTWVAGIDCSSNTPAQECSEDTGAATCVDPYVCPEDTNDNNTAETAIMLDTFPVVDEAGFACSEVHDWYKLDLAVGDTIQVDLTFLNADGDIDMSLYQGLPTADSSSVSSAGSTDDNETITYTATEAGTYYIDINTDWVDEGVAYTMGVTLTPGCTDNTTCTEGNANLCKVDAGVCVECLADTDCGNSETCTNNVCLETTANGCIGLSFDTLEINPTYGTYDGEVAGFNLGIEFLASTPVGTYDLASAGVNDNYATCEQCVFIYTINEAGDAVEKSFFQESGSLEVTAGDAYSTQEALASSAGQVLSVKLIEVTVDDQGDTPSWTSTPVVDGECIEMQTGTTWSWDNTVE